MAQDYIHILSTKGEETKKLHGLPEVLLVTSTYIALARMQSYDQCAREAGKCSLLAEWPRAQLKSVLLLKKKWKKQTDKQKKKWRIVFGRQPLVSAMPFRPSLLCQIWG